MPVYVIYEVVTYLSRTQVKIVAVFSEENKAQEYVRLKGFGRYLQIQETEMNPSVYIFRSAVDYIT